MDFKNQYSDIVYKDCIMTMHWSALYEPYVGISGRWKYCKEYIGSSIVEYGFKMRKVAIQKIKFELDNDILSLGGPLLTSHTRHKHLDLTHANVGLIMKLTLVV